MLGYYPTLWYPVNAFDILTAQPVLNKLLKFNLPIVGAMHVAPHFKAAAEIYKQAVEERAEIYQRYGVRDEEKGTTEIPEENKEDFATEYTLFMEREYDWPLQPLDPIVFEGVELSASEANKITWFFI